MAGLGPVNTNLSDILKLAGVRSGITDPKNELEIFCSLCVGRVYYRAQNRSLYYVESPALSISDIVKQVFEGLGQSPRIRQLHMDEHDLFRAALCLQLTATQKPALFAALTLSGINIVH